MFGKFWAFQDRGVLCRSHGIHLHARGCYRGRGSHRWEKGQRSPTGIPTGNTIREREPTRFGNADYVRLGNEYLERVFRVSDGVVRTAELLNKVGGRSPGCRTNRSSASKWTVKSRGT